MKEQEIKNLLEQFEAVAFDYEGVECWSARELQKLLDYSEWRNFCKIIDKAKDSCKNANISISDHFVDVNKMVEMPKNAEKIVDDIFLTRYASYLVAQNGDSRKPQAENVNIKNLSGVENIEQEHIENNTSVRKIMVERGLIPENLPPAEDVKKVERRLQSEKKKLDKKK